CTSGAGTQPVAFIPGTVSSPMVAPNGDVLIAARIESNSTCSGLPPGEYLWKIVNGVLSIATTGPNAPRLLDAGNNSNGVSSLAVRADGTVFYAFHNNSPSSMTLKALKTDNSVVDVPGAPSNAHQVSFGADGLLYIVDQPNHAVRIFAPPAVLP
ncbi:MAG TPA: hypothetical protein VGO62_11505, partial [Myxococcota bacterium]